jgi:hypothetical protein
MNNPEEIYEKNITTLLAIHADIASGNAASLKKHRKRPPNTPCVVKRAPTYAAAVQQFHSPAASAVA